MKKITKTILTLAFAIFLSGCSTSNGHYRAISSKPLPLSSINNYNIMLARKAEATSARHVFVVIPSGRAPTVADAINEILTKYDGDYLANADIYNKSFQIMWLYHYTSWHVSGDVVKVRR